ncbi:MAG: DNA helicase RecQ [Pseudomonadota bacterium]
MDLVRNTPEAVLKDVFGYDAFRSAQGEIIDGLIAGKDAVVIMPTGAGKSLCYQIPALIRPGVCIVISPLIALMDDQVAAARSFGMRATALNSAQEFDSTIAAENALESGALDLLFVAPERANLPSFHELISRCDVALIAIDEAHCVSQWGHDFRPDYRQLGPLLDMLRGVPRVALTATADSRTQIDIAEQLGIAQDRLFVSGFDRPNITYQVGLKNNPMQQLRRFLAAQEDGAAGIVYCQTRNRVDEVAKALATDGHTALPYHAGLEPEIRARNQSRFLREDGIIMVATVAFGMGINKPDVRFVAHLDLPKTIEAYYQETGRAGRDDLPATAWMVYGGSDVAQARRFILQSDADETQKKLELSRLNALISYCETADCRLEPLLSYFGERYKGPCTACDNCLSPPEQIDITVDMQKLLSAAIRTGEVYGFHYLVDVLRGQAGEKAVRFGHDQLKLYGIGAKEPKSYWLSVANVALAKKYLVENDKGFGGLKLTPAGWDAIKGAIPLTMRKERLEAGSKKKLRKAAVGDLPLDAQALFTSLKAWRLGEAKAQDVPAFVIFGDATLKAIAVHKPQSEAELLEISGVGAKKIERYGTQLLSEIKSA